MWRNNTAGFHQTSTDPPQRRWTERQRFRKTTGLLARGQVDRRRPEPSVARPHLRIVRCARMHTDQNIFRQHRAIGNVGAVPHKTAPGNNGRAQADPATVDFLVTEQHGIGNKGFVTQRE